MIRNERVFRRLSTAAITCLTTLGLAMPFIASSQQPDSDELRAGFANPPNSARPRVWWHWMNGNVTKDGIRKDMEWMSRVGIGGLQNFDAALMTPQIVEKRLAYMTPEWKDAFRYTAGLADQLGLELAIAASPGWSETGGPWVTPVEGMKKLVWTETVVTGGRRFNGQLPAPPDVTGPFQSMPKQPGIEEMLGAGAKKSPPPTHYDDVAVVAYRLSDVKTTPTPTYELNAGDTLDAAALSDASYETAVEVEKGAEDNPASIVMRFETPQAIRSATLFVPGGAALFIDSDLRPRLEARDGSDWRKVTDVPVTDVPATVSFAPVTAREFRLVLTRNPGPAGLDMGGVPGAANPFAAALAPKKTVRIADLRISGEPRINRFEAKAAFSVARDYYAIDADVGTDEAGAAPASVVNLTDRLGADGKLDWTPPAGRWKVLRFGYSLTGTTNHPATPEATGLEVDKYDGKAVRKYLETYIGMYTDTTGQDLIGKRGLRALLTDSIEVGPSNWTPELAAHFRRLRGYDLLPWLPAIAGNIVGSRSRSDAFLYDFRRTLAELVASEHYAQVAAVAHEHGLTVYGEALENGRPSLGDDLTMRSHADIPMAALWTTAPGREHQPSHLADMKGAASVAHIYGQNLVAAESLTSAMSPWAFAPADLKRHMDLEFAHGINRPVIHTSVHQPVDDKVPGLSLMIFGQYFNRHETWAEMAKPWVDYMARSSYLLQQGRYFADVAYFHGEEAPLVALYERSPVNDAPARYGYDFVNSDVLLHQLEVDGPDLAAKSGARYRVLYLGGTSRRMTLPVLKRIAQLVEAGATVVGAAPESSPSLNDDPSEFKALVQRLWSGGPATSVGKGKVMAGNDVEGALTSIGLAPDFNVDKTDAKLLFLHRRLPDGDAYFVNNRKDQAESVDVRFRVTGRKPEVWRADTGTTEPVSYRTEKDGTLVSLDLSPQDAVFVVFRSPASATSETVSKPAWARAGEVKGPWTVSFQPGRGAPESARFDTLQSFSDSSDPGVKYFSGVASYRNSFTPPRAARPGASLMLDLGTVGDVAEVLVNGKSVGTVWKAPYRIDIGKALRSGKNELEVRVANLWVNRLIGDVQPGAKKVTFTAAPTYNPDAPLRPSGLIGPVSLLTAESGGRE